jgi:hypothetical protein
MCAVTSTCRLLEYRRVDPKGFVCFVAGEKKSFPNLIPFVLALTAFKKSGFCAY